MKTISITDQTYAHISKLSSALNMSPDKGVEHYLSRFVFEPLHWQTNFNIIKEAEQIVCSSKHEARALAESE
jgi:hypothetical protein